VSNPKFLKSKSYSVLETSEQTLTKTLTSELVNDKINQNLNDYTYEDEYEDEYDDEDDENDDSSQAELFSFNNNSEEAVVNTSKTNKKEMCPQPRCSVFNGNQRFKKLTPKSVSMDDPIQVIICVCVFF
jgi:hypothetical protein